MSRKRSHTPDDAVRSPPSGAADGSVNPRGSAPSRHAKSRQRRMTPPEVSSALPASGLDFSAVDSSPDDSSPSEPAPSRAADSEHRVDVPQPRSSPRAVTFQQRFRAQLIWFAALVVIGALSWVALREKVDDGIRSQIQKLLAARYPNLRVEVDWGRRMGDRGLELRGIRFSDPRLAPPFREVLTVQRMEIRCDSRLASLAQGDVRIDHLHVEGVRLRGVRTQTGDWSFTCLVPTKGDGPPQTPSIELTDGEIELIDERHPDSKLALWRDVQLHFSPASWTNSQGPHSSGPNLQESDPPQLADPSPNLGSERSEASAEEEADVAAPLVWTFGGEMLSGRLGRTEISGWMAALDQWHLQGRVENLIVDDETWDLLPDSAWKKLGPPPRCGAKVAIDFRLDQEPQAPIFFATTGTVSDGWLDDRRVDYPLTAVRSEFEFNSNHLVFSNLFAKTGDAEIRGSGEFHDFQLAKPFHVSLDFRRFPVDERLRDLLTDRHRATWDKFHPLGRISGTASFTFDGERLSPQLDVSCQDGEVTYHRFPYRVRGATGDIHFSDNHLTVEGTAPLSGTTASLSADLRNPGPAALGVVQIDTLGHVPLDQDLIDAMPSKVRQTIEEMNPRGWFKVSARFEHGGEQVPTGRHMTIDVRDGAIEYVKFPYPIHHIRGVIEVDDDRWSFDDLRGANGSGFISATGRWDPDQRIERNLTLTMTCNDVPLDEELQQALPVGMNRLWDDLHPNGTIDYLKVHLGYDLSRRDLSVDVLGQKWDPHESVQREAALRAAGQEISDARQSQGISMIPSWFPYRFEDVTGTFRYVNGQITLRDVRGRHGHSRIRRLNGGGQVNRYGEWALNLDDVVIADLALDRDLVEAFPDSVIDGLSRLRIAGPLGVQGRISFAGGPGEQPETDWKLDFDLEDARIECGAALEHVRGQVLLVGSAGPRGFACDGNLALDSVFFRDHHLVNVRGPVRFDAKNFYVGSFATLEQRRQIPESVQAQLLGGTLSIDAKVAASSGGMNLELALESADLREIGREFGLQRADVSGKSSVSASLVGKSNDPQTWRGGGVVRLWDADLYESPFMARLLSVLKNARYDKSAFSQSNMEYRVEGDRIVFDRVTLEGPIRLQGRGELTRQRQLDMNFYVELLDEKRQLPFFRPLAMGANKNALSIRVTGTLDEPIITKQPFPDLNRGLQEIFVESNREDDRKNGR